MTRSLLSVTARRASAMQDAVTEPLLWKPWWTSHCWRHLSLLLSDRSDSKFQIVNTEYNPVFFARLVKLGPVSHVQVRGGHVAHVQQGRGLRATAVGTADGQLVETGGGARELSWTPVETWESPREDTQRDRERRTHSHWYMQVLHTWSQTRFAVYCLILRFPLYVHH